ncbi:MAG TPA: anhydro-N-acetylmuramic acid kinase [Flavobacteriales bacterium]|nr:anhydro-N-acetylmuramic acid kinase [Flavobacteriales bacterium]
MNSKNEYLVLGLMSGTSLDGLDLALSKFSLRNGKWDFNTIACKTLAYNHGWLAKLSSAHKAPKEELAKLHVVYGNYLGESARDFLNLLGKSPDFISSHGHTIFHEPQKGITFQLGNGEAIAKTSGLTTISDFRTLDVSLGGQGAPLVPIGDKLLFSDYVYCINLGGFANVSYDLNGVRIAYDVCPANIALNYLCASLNVRFDNDGEIAKNGNVNDVLLNDLNGIRYFQQSFPKSLGREWFENDFLVVLNKHNLSTEDKLTTVVRHIAKQISSITRNSNNNSIIITGGGAHNSYLISCITDALSIIPTIPESEIVDFKEAIIFGFLGVLRIRNEVNCLKSVTGATRDSSSGSVFHPH